MSEDYDDHQDWKRQEELRERHWDEHYEAALKQHPHCTDPDHPGCEHCSTPIGTPVRYN